MIVRRLERHSISTARPVSARARRRSGAARPLLARHGEDPGGGGSGGSPPVCSTSARAGTDAHGFEAGSPQTEAPLAPPAAPPRLGGARPGDPPSACSPSGRPRRRRSVVRQVHPLGVHGPEVHTRRAESPRAGARRRPSAPRSRSRSAFPRRRAGQPRSPCRQLPPRARGRSRPAAGRERPRATRRRRARLPRRSGGRPPSRGHLLPDVEARLAVVLRPSGAAYAAN